MSAKRTNRKGEYRCLNFIASKGTIPSITPSAICRAALTTSTTIRCAFTRQKKTTLTGHPFVELIDFADNEGYIGPTVAAKLARDFAQHEASILSPEVEGWQAKLYRDWRHAFELAADNGCVDLH